MYTIRGEADVRRVGRVEVKIILVAAKPECSIAELREVKRKADKEKIFRGIQPQSSDFQSQLNCNFKSY